MGKSLWPSDKYPGRSLWTPEPAPTLAPAERTLQRSIRRQARRAFDPVALRRCCVDPSDSFQRYGTVNRFGDGPDDFYIYKDNGSSVLAVAHLDSVQDKRRFTMNDDRDNPVVWSPTLDDRLGAYVIAELLPKLGIKSDLLLTSGEEVCNSSARMFGTDKRYNWMFSFDRGGTDVVTYQYESDELHERIRAAGAPVGNGSYSDIADLDHLGCVGMNWGVGYRDYHGKYAHVPLNDLYLSVARFVRFWQAHSGVSLPYTAAPRWWQYGGFESGSTADVDVECPACGEESFDPAAGLCVTCGYDENEPAVTHRLHGLSEKEWTRIEKQAQESTDVA